MNKYIVIATPAYGGAEKRFFDIVMRLRSTGLDVKIIAPSILVEQFIKDHQNDDKVAAALISIEMRKWNRLEFVVKLFKLLRALPPKAIFHYPMNCMWFLHVGRDDIVSMSYTNCTKIATFYTLSFRTLRTWIAFFFVQRIDVLNPQIFMAMKSDYNFKKMSLTPGGTYLAPFDVPTLQKKPYVVLLSRFVKGKGIDNFFDVLPAVWDKLFGEVPIGFVFKIAGYGPLQEKVISRVNELSQSGVPIEFVGFVNSTNFFSESSIVLSMQKFTNYPSRVVAEALYCGCAVIVRDTGDSREFGENLPGLSYCMGNLDPNELAGIISKQLMLVLNESFYTEEIMDSAARRFSRDEYLLYFREILDK